MELELNRVEYCSVGTTLPNSMKLLPNAYKQQQRIAAGDQDGVLQVFSMKKDEVQIHFKTLPAEKVQSVQLGGPLGNIPDKVFVASDNKVRGFNKKGKMFLAFDTNLTEPIKSMFVSGNDLLICGNHVYNHYRDCKDIGSYLCGDTIVDVVALCPGNTPRIITALACSGRVIRLLEHCRVRQSIELGSVPTILHVPEGSGDRIICGMADGRVVMLKVTHYANEVKEEVLVNDAENTNAVTAIDTYDLTGDGKIELILGRRDGSVQIYSMPSEDNAFDVETRLIYSENFSESISSIQGGCVGAQGYTEVVVCTYTGRIFGLSTQCIKLTLTDSASSNNIASIDTTARLDKLREEIKEIEQKVQKERDRYKLSTQSMSAGISAIPMISINDTIVLSKEDGSYSLSIEIPAPIEFVLVQCDVPIELLDVEKNTAVVSISKSDAMSGNHLLATYRCQIDRNRLDLKFRTIEGQQGTLQAFITPNIQPKVSQLRSYPIRALSLHMRMHSFDETRPLNLLTLKGSFSHAEIHNWIKNCIPEVPEKLQITTGERSVLYFKNVFIGTSLACEYCKGHADFKTENVSTISILKDFITKEATKRKVKLEISNAVDPSSIPFMIKLIEPNILKHSKIKSEYSQLMALIDLDIRNEEELACLNEDYKSIMSRKDDIIEAYKNSPAILDRIFGLLTDCYIDFNKLKGINVKLKVPELLRLLHNYDFQNLVAFHLGEAARSSP